MRLWSLHRPNSGWYVGLDRGPVGVPRASDQARSVWVLQVTGLEGVRCERPLTDTDFSVQNVWAFVCNLLDRG